MGKGTFTKHYHSLYACEEINLTEITILSLIISYYENGLRVYMTNQQFEEQLFQQVKFNTIKAIIPALRDKGFIDVLNIRKNHPEFKKWGNSRIISVTQKTITILNTEVNSNTETTITSVTEQEPVIEENTTQLLNEEYDELDETLAVIGIEPFEDVNEIEELIEKLEGEQEVDDAIEKLKVVYVDDDVFKEKIPYIKMCSYDGDGYCLKRFEKRVTENKGKFVKRKKPSVVS